MRIKTYAAKTEQEAIELVKDDLGLSALVLNIKTVKPKGLKRFFKKPSVEVTACPDEPGESAPPPAAVVPNDADKQRIITQQMKISLLEQELESKENLLEKAASLLSAAKHQSGASRKYDNNMVQIFYDALTGQGVTGEIAESLLADAARLTKPTDLALIVRVVYNNILDILTRSMSAGLSDTAKVYCFLGPTGVGKTTTIAKLASGLVFNENIGVGLITADTYRIAAVEQLKTYAEILGIDIAVVYSSRDLADILPKMESFSDIVIIDTAGRSHQNAEMIQELKELLDVKPESKRYLLLSLTTKYEDLLSIITSYSEFTDFDIIFTKADETLNLGIILNICYLAKNKIAYITNGQNVPDDITKPDPAKIAKSLMGIGGLY